MKKLISIVLILSLVLSLGLPLSVFAKDSRIETIDDEFVFELEEPDISTETVEDNGDESTSTETTQNPSPEDNTENSSEIPSDVVVKNNEEHFCSQCDADHDGWCDVCGGNYATFSAKGPVPETEPEENPESYSFTFNKTFSNTTGRTYLDKQFDSLWTSDDPKLSKITALKNDYASTSSSSYKPFTPPHDENGYYIPDDYVEHFSLFDLGGTTIVYCEKEESDPESIDFILYNDTDGSNYQFTLSKENDWTLTLTDNDEDQTLAYFIHKLGVDLDNGGTYHIEELDMPADTTLVVSDITKTYSDSGSTAYSFALQNNGKTHYTLKYEDNSYTFSFEKKFETKANKVYIHKVFASVFDNGDRQITPLNEDGTVAGSSFTLQHDDKGYYIPAKWADQYSFFSFVVKKGTILGSITAKEDMTFGIRLTKDESHPDSIDFKLYNDTDGSSYQFTLSEENDWEITLTNNEDNQELAAFIQKLGRDMDVGGTYHIEELNTPNNTTFEYNSPVFYRLFYPPDIPTIMGISSSGDRIETIDDGPSIDLGVHDNGGSSTPNPDPEDNTGDGEDLKSDVTVTYPDDPEPTPEPTPGPDLVAYPFYDSFSSEDITEEQYNSFNNYKDFSKQLAGYHTLYLTRGDKIVSVADGIMVGLAKGTRTAFGIIVENRSTEPISDFIVTYPVPSQLKDINYKISGSYQILLKDDLTKKGNRITWNYKGTLNPSEALCFYIWFDTPDTLPDGLIKVFDTQEQANEYVKDLNMYTGDRTTGQSLPSDVFEHSHIDYYLKGTVCNYCGDVGGEHNKEHYCDMCDFNLDGYCDVCGAHYGAGSAKGPVPDDSDNNNVEIIETSYSVGYGFTLKNTINPYSAKYELVKTTPEPTPTPEPEATPTPEPEPEPETGPYSFVFEKEFIYDGSDKVYIDEAFSRYGNFDPEYYTRISPLSSDYSVAALSFEVGHDDNGYYIPAEYVEKYNRFGIAGQVVANISTANIQPSSIDFMLYNDTDGSSYKFTLNSSNGWRIVLRENDDDSELSRFIHKLGEDVANGGSYHIVELNTPTGTTFEFSSKTKFEAHECSENDKDGDGVCDLCLYPYVTQAGIRVSDCEGYVVAMTNTQTNSYSVSYEPRSIPDMPLPPYDSETPEIIETPPVEYTTTEVEKPEPVKTGEDNDSYGVYILLGAVVAACVVLPLTIIKKKKNKN